MGRRKNEYIYWWYRLREFLQLKVDKERRSYLQNDETKGQWISLGDEKDTRFKSYNMFLFVRQIPAHYHQQSYVFVPYVPDHTQQAIPVMEMTTMTQPMEPRTHANEEVNSNDEGFIEVEKE